MDKRSSPQPIMKDPISLQRDYYRKTASQYDEAHVGLAGEHATALTFLCSMIGFLGVRSVLDVGSGSGRALLTIKRTYPAIHVVGIEPSAEMRAQGHEKGLSSEELFDGDAQCLSFRDTSFDLVCEFGVLHHLPKPSQAVCEMLRVARTAIFISDSNNFGQGSWASRSLKQMINAVGLWRAADFIKTGGKRYTVYEGDGVAYSYSVFNDYPLIASRCTQVHLMNTSPAGYNLYRSAPHVALLGLKKMD